MNLHIKILWPLLLLFLTFNIAHGDDVQDAKNLGQAIQSDLTLNYMCQEYLGSNNYRTAKLSAISTFTQITGDKNMAVINIENLEKKLKKNHTEANIKEYFGNKNLSKIDIINACQDMVTESHDKVQLLKAKLGLLK